jgi:hypothetical protein
MTNKLSIHFNEEFEKEVSMEVTKIVNNIIGDDELEQKLVSIHVDDEFNKRILKDAIKWYKDMEAWPQEIRDPNPQLISMW